jgi:hypothetical protein
MRPKVFCPECRSEYREGFTKCADCGVELVPECPIDEALSKPIPLLPSLRDARPLPDNVPLISVLDSPDEGLLLIAKSILDNEGIPCLIQNNPFENRLGIGHPYDPQ